MKSGKRAATTRRAAPPNEVSKGEKAVRGRSAAHETPASIRCVGLSLDEAFRTYMQRRLGFKFGKFARHITRLSLRFEDVAGPKQAPVIACRVRVVFPNLASVVVESREQDARVAFDEGADACERAVRRSLERDTRTSAPKGARTTRRGRTT